MDLKSDSCSGTALGTATRFSLRCGLLGSSEPTVAGFSDGRAGSAGSVGVSVGVMLGVGVIFGVGDGVGVSVGTGMVAMASSGSGCSSASPGAALLGMIVLSPAKPFVPLPKPAPAPAPAPTPAFSAISGKSIYAASCSGCHGVNPALNGNKILRGANSASAISNAITGNAGGMGFLSGTIGAQQSGDLAAYLATPGI